MKKLTKQKISSPLLSIAPMLIYLLLLIIFMLSTELFLKFLNGGTLVEEKISQYVFDILINPAAIGTAAAFACLFVKRYKKIRLKDSIRIKDFDIMVPLMLLIFTWGCAELCDHFSGLILSAFMVVEPNPSVPANLGGIISAVICAPIFEELMFRYAGIELPRGIYKMPVICIANGIYFSVVHFYNIQGFFNIFIGGVVAAYVYYKTKNILYTMLEHALHNLICFIEYDRLTLFGKTLYYEKNGFVLNAWWWNAFNLALVIISIVWYYKVFKIKYAQNDTGGCLNEA